MNIALGINITLTGLLIRLSIVRHSKQLRKMGTRSATHMVSHPQLRRPRGPQRMLDLGSSRVARVATWRTELHRIHLVPSSNLSILIFSRTLRQLQPAWDTKPPPVDWTRTQRLQPRHKFCFCRWQLAHRAD